MYLPVISVVLYFLGTGVPPPPYHPPPAPTESGLPPPPPPPPPPPHPLQLSAGCTPDPQLLQLSHHPPPPPPQPIRGRRFRPRGRRAERRRGGRGGSAAHVNLTLKRYEALNSLQNVSYADNSQQSYYQP